MAAIENYWLDEVSAAKNIAIAYQLTQNDNNIINRALVLINYSLISFCAGNTNDALNKILELEAVQLSEALPSAVLTLYISWKGFLIVNQGYFSEAELFFKQWNLNVNNDIAVTEIHRYTPLALWLILMSHFDEAELLLSKLWNLALLEQRQEHLCEIKVLKASLFHGKGENNKAVKYLVESMEISSDENIMVYYVVHWSQISSLTDAAFSYIATHQTSVSDTFVTKLKNAFNKNKHHSNNNTYIDLTQRELDVLKLIDEHYTNQQIAEQLFISLHTVKSHVKNILQKLEVDRRSKTGDKAREVGIKF